MSGQRFGHISRKRKTALMVGVAKMQKAKARKRQAQSEKPPDGSALSMSTCVDESLHVSGAREDNEELEAVFEEEDSTRDITVDYKQWINSLQREDQQTLAMMLYDNYRERFGLLKK